MAVPPTPAQTPPHHAGPAFLYVGNRNYVGNKAKGTDANGDLDGTISQFRVGPGGALRPLNPPTVSTGHAPYLLAADPKGQFLYAAVTDGDKTIRQYRIRPDGTLAPLTPLALPFQRVLPYEGPRKDVLENFTAITFAPDGRYAYALTGNPYTQQGTRHGVALAYRVGSGGHLLRYRPRA